jgi:phosphohistidine phosphatase
MQKTFVLVRHAKSSWSDPTLSDFERPLNNRGLRDAPKMARFLKISPDLLISSPAQRARQTAQIFAEAKLYSQEDILYQDAIYEAFPDELHHLLKKINTKYSCVFMFGHNPGMHLLTERMAGREIPKFPTCACAVFTTAAVNWTDIAPDNCRLELFIYPKALP